MMANVRACIALLVLLRPAGCARAVPIGPGPDGSDLGPSGDTPGPQVGTSDPSQATDASFLKLLDGAPVDGPPSDGAPTLAADGSVGLSGSGRTCAPATCDELQENRQ